MSKQTTHLQHLPKPPATLSPKAKEQWQRYVSEFEIRDAHGLFILGQAMEAYDQMLAAQEDVKKNGPKFTNRVGDVKANPSVTHIRAARAAMLATLEKLHLDVEK